MKKWENLRGKWAKSGRVGDECDFCAGNVVLEQGRMNLEMRRGREEASRLRASVANFNRLNEWPLQFLRTGRYSYSDGLLNNRTMGGYWWSATRSSATNASDLYTGISSVYSQGSGSRGDGFAVRCEAR